MAFDRFSHHARRALTHAGLLAVRCQHAAVDTGHVLVGILLAEGSVGSQVLREVGMLPNAAETHLRSLYPTVHNSDHPSNTAAFDQALLNADDEVHGFGHHYTGTEHLLLGICRTSEGRADTLMHLLDTSPEQIRRRVRRLLLEGTTEISLAEVKRNASLSELSRRVINAAEQNASARGQSVGLGHLLLIMLGEVRSPVAVILREFSLDAALLRSDLDNHSPALLSGIEMVLDAAIDIADNRGSHYTGTDHLLLSLAVDPAGAELLRVYGVDPASVLHRLGHSPV